jgi:mitochondrial chaperone BCS1
MFDLDTIWQFAAEQLKDNHFLAGGGILMALGGIAAYLRNFPRDAWDWIQSRCIIQVDVTDRDPAFLWFTEWLAAQPYTGKRARRLTITTAPVADDDDDHDGVGPVTATPKGKTRVLLSPAVGRHYFFYRGRLVALHRERKDGDDKGGDRSSLFSRESYTLKMFTRNRENIRRLIEDARTIAEPPEDNRVKVWNHHRYSSWCQALKRRHRPVESVILAGGIMDRLVADLSDFIAREAWYFERGIPYRRTYLLYGPPGTGKSSIVLALASHFGVGISTVNLASESTTDDSLRDQLIDMPAGTFGLIEDIDCLFADRGKTDDNPSKLTFAGLLNALDGVSSSDSRIMFLTTNHREKMDPALLRPGRCDVQFEIGNADHSQVCRIFERFFPDATPSQTLAFVEQIPARKVSMSAIQGLLVKYKDSIDDTIKHAGELCTS